MNLQLVIGGSGMGKTTYVYNEIINAAVENPQKNYIVIVPEQYTMETQKALVKMHPNHGLFNIDILSFQRLSYKIIQEVGGKLNDMLDDTGKNLIIRKCIDDHKKELKVLSGMSNKIDFVPQIKAAISEYMQYDISVEKAYEMAGLVDNSLLAAKLSDIAIIYDSFKQFIADKYLTTEELLTYVSHKVEESEKLADSVLVLDGFTGFTPIQYRLLEALYKKAAKVWVTLTIDAEEQYNVLDGVNNLFYICKETVASLYKMADDCHGNVESPVILDDIAKSRFAQNEELYYLGKKLFAPNKKAYDKKSENIIMVNATSPMDEVKFVASEILRLTRGAEGIRYRDIAVIAGNIDDYGRYTEKVFIQNNIPVFVDEKRSLIKHDFIDMIRSAIDIFVDNYSYDSVMRFAKNQFVPISDTEANILENYCLATGVRGRSKWEKAFSKKLSKYSYKIDIDAVNASREKLMDIISPLAAAFKKKDSNAGEMTDAIKAFMDKLEVKQVVEEASQDAEEAFDFGLASFYNQLLDKLESLFNQIKELLGNEDMNYKDFAKLLDAGFSELKVGIIPPGMDYVLVGDMTRTRIDNKKVVFCLGLNEGNVLTVGTSKNIIGNDDRNSLKNAGVKLSPDDTEKTYTQRLYLYMNMTKPVNKLYLSYSACDWKGSGLVKSNIITGVGKLFPNIKVINFKEKEYARLLDNLATIEARLKWEETKLEEMIAKETAEGIYGENIVASISRMETYAQCAFAHFVSYGLELKEREEFEVTGIDIGNVLHSIFESAFRSCKENGTDYQLLDEAAIDALIESKMKPIEDKYAESAFMDTSRNRAIWGRVKSITKTSMRALTKHIAAGSFRPYDFEYKIDTVWDNGMKYTGKIDRIDVCEEADKVYVKLVDYKSGKSDFKWEDVYEGLKIQLLVYMKVAKEKLEKDFPGKEIVPAAVFYYHLDDPVVEMTSGDVKEDSVKQKLLKSYSPAGIVLSDNGIIEKLQTGYLGGSVKTSDIIPVKLNNEKTAAADGESTLTDVEFDAVLDYVSEKLTQNSNDIIAGKIAVNPVKKGVGINERTSCDYCKYKGICGFDRTIFGDKMKRIAEMTKQEMLEAIAKEDE